MPELRGRHPPRHLTGLADRIALVETLGAALDTHRLAEQAVTTARTTAAWVLPETNATKSP